MLVSRKILLIIFSTLLLLTVSCAHKKNNEDPVDTRDAIQLYEDGLKEIEAKRYKAATESFSKIAYEFPYDDLAPKAHIMEIYSYYLMSDYDSLIPAVENYIKIFPASQDIPYVYYLRTLAYYEQIDAPVRDQTMTIEAKAALEDLIARFPNTPYAKDAKIKIDLVNDHLAGQEMIIGRYYLHAGDLISAINRFKVVVDTYPTTTHIQEALYRLTEAYLFLGVVDEAKKNASVLGYNYPNSIWYKDAYKLLQK
ncbi:MAG: outer membrane protein assembly factor BamD [Alphaproteobacteria bacterium]|jgi:outer membrane protein assembly factor BamD